MTEREEVNEKLNMAIEEVIKALEDLTINQASHVLTLSFISMLSDKHNVLKACGIDTKAMDVEELMQLQLLFTKANERDIDELLQE